MEAYSGALLRSPASPVLFANRAAALMHRGWDGDVYAALRDAAAALNLHALEGGQHKALFRLAKCLAELRQAEAAGAAVSLFRTRFPREAAAPAFHALVAAVADLPGPDLPEAPAEESRPGGVGDGEAKARVEAGDYSGRFLGHCNTTTDIKEAAFLGEAWVAAGSDDGRFFVWERASGRLLRALKGDSSIVNAIQPHPEALLVATAGIDATVKLWSPRPVLDTAEPTPHSDPGAEEEEASPLEELSEANQRRMAADPFEAMLLQFVGRRGEEAGEGDEGPRQIQCAQS